MHNDNIYNYVYPWTVYFVRSFRTVCLFVQRDTFSTFINGERLAVDFSSIRASVTKPKISIIVDCILRRTSPAILFPKSYFPPEWNSDEAHIAGGEIQLPERHNNCTRGKQFGFGRSAKFSVQLLPHFRRPSNRNPRLLTIDFSQVFAFPPQGNDFLLTEILFSHYEESHYPQAVYMVYLLPSKLGQFDWLVTMICSCKI